MQNHIMEAMAAQDYILRSHQHMMQLAHANVRGPVRPSIGGPPTRPFMGLDLVEPRVPVGPHQIMHLQVNQAPDAGTAMNFPGRMEAARRMLQPVFGAGPGAGGMMNQFANRPGASPGIGAVRQQGVWASPPLGGQMPQLPIGRARGQVRGRGQMVGPLWGDFQAQGISTGIPAHPGGIGQGVAINVGPAFGPGGMMDMGSPKRQSSIPQMMRGNSIDTNREMSSNMNREVHHGEVDGLRRADEGNKGVGTSNGLVPHGFWSANPGMAPADIKRHRESVQHRQKSFSHPVPGPVTAPIRHINNGKGPNVGTAGNNHLIQLGGQLQKSRVLIVSGLLENTSMAVVVEAFEKQGKITDFKKEERGDAFAITFASVQEATSAKRSLHRTILAGQQITVEYAMPRD
jgi:hypothetical protein